MSNYLFYSGSCNMSLTLIDTLNKRKIIGFFKLICVDRNLNECMNKGITNVPTMIVNTGTSQVKYVGIETLKFVENMKQLKMKQIQTSGDSSSYIGWAEQEMSGMSDGYAYVDIDKPLTHGYFDYK